MFRGSGLEDEAGGDDELTGAMGIGGEHGRVG